MYMIGDKATELDLTLYAVGDFHVDLTVYNDRRVALSNAVFNLKDGDAKSVVMTLSKSEDGHHELVSRIKNTVGELIEQTTSDFHLMEEQTPPPSLPPNTGDYEFVFPENIKNYTAGTKVLAEDGAIYQCKPFPDSGYCNQWSATATNFAPGVGSHWESAWIRYN
eukprot:GHVL01030257.1.p1 GENE.GHVL01030257.1~~GHVL01030257.1.p1  ORF type:complete len:194 (+),score=18.89 GHVL01030257.1:88-582(+)